MIKISDNNRYEYESYQVIDGKYEYDKEPLTGLQSKYIYIPLSVITDAELDARRIGVYSYLRIRCGLDNVIGLTISDMVEWFGWKPDKRINGVNDKTLLVMDALSDRGYLTYLTDKSRTLYMKCWLDIDYCYEECSNGYSVMYLDEIEKIMNYRKEDMKNNTINTTILLVFAYLRNKIKRRPNELKPEERSHDFVKDRRIRLPDAYDSNINNIADELGLSVKTVSNILDILECELKLIVTDRAYRVKNKKNEFRTLPIIFANAYKREDKYLLITGENYSRTEIKLKANNMKLVYSDYKIDKRKRKLKGGINSE